MWPNFAESDAESQSSCVLSEHFLSVVTDINVGRNVANPGGVVHPVLLVAVHHRLDRIFDHNRLCLVQGHTQTDRWNHTQVSALPVYCCSQRRTKGKGHCSGTVWHGQIRCAAYNTRQRSRTLSCSHTAIRRPFNGLDFGNPCNYMDYFSLTDSRRMEGWVGLVGWPIADSLPTKLSPVNHRSGIV